MYNLFKFIVFFVIFSIFGCTTYSRNSDTKIVPSKLSSNFNVSLSFINKTHSGSIERIEIRIDQSSLAEKITKEIEELNLFKSITREIESYESTSDVVIEFIFSDELIFGDPRLGIVLPIPENHVKILTSNVYDKNRLRKKYEASIDYQLWRFFLLFPIRIYQLISKDKYYAETILIHDILKNLKQDIESGTF